MPQRLMVPHKAFNRQIGALAGITMSPDGRVVERRGMEGARRASGCRRRPTARSSPR